MPIVLLLGMMRGWDRSGGEVVDSYQGVGGVTGGVYYVTVFFFFNFYLWFCLLVSHALSLF